MKKEKNKRMISILKRIAGYIIPYRAYLYLSKHKYALKQVFGLNKSQIANIDNRLQNVGIFWSDYYISKRPKRESWWQSDLVKRHVNILVANVDSNILSDGLNSLLLKRLRGKRLKQGVSVGCGNGDKEIRLLQLNVVEKFILFELSEEMVRVVKDKAIRLNLADRIEIRLENAFLHDFTDVKIDFIHWNNSLHHMFDVPAAIKWSYDILESDGVFYMDDYVGPTRFQYSEKAIHIVNEIRDDLPHKYLKSQYHDGQYFGHYINCDPNIFETALGDPSEAVDSGRILKSLKDYFPEAEIILTGGIIYFVALGGLYENFDEKNEKDVSVLNTLLERDKNYAQSLDDMSPYAVALAIK